MINLQSWLKSAITANVIAMIALMISLFSWWFNIRKTICEVFQANILVLSPKEIFIDGINDLKVPVVFATQVDIVNYTSNNLSYFDLRAYNPRTNINYQIITEKSVPFGMTQPVITIKTEEIEIKQDIPIRTYGILPANSFTRLDILIYDKDINLFEDVITVAFKIPKTVWFRKDPHSITARKKFKVYGINYHINGFKDLLAQKQPIEESPDTHKQ